MRNDTEDTKNSAEIEREFTTCVIKVCSLKTLHDMTIAPREPPYSVIERLIEEHDLKSMRKVVSKRVR